MGAATVAFDAGWIAPLDWMILTGAGLFLAYTPFNAMLFDRMFAAVGSAGNAGFLIYVADATAYGGSVALLLYRSFGATQIDWLPFFIRCIYAGSAIVALLTALSAAVFLLRDAAPLPLTRSTPAS